MDNSPPAYVELDPARFRGEVDGHPVALYTLRNHRGMVACITNYGARVQQIVVPDRDGRLADVAQGYESIEDVIAGQPSMGAFIGRYANRIANGRFALDGNDYVLSLNDVSTDPAHPRSSTLHGGTRGSRFLPFTAQRHATDSVAMTLRFADGEEGFPGTLSLRVLYTLTPDNELVIDYEAIAIDKKTVINFTGHTFFNLSGSLGETITDTLLIVNADEVLEIGPAALPSGKLRRVEGTPMDFRRPKAIGTDIAADYDLLQPGRGYDNHYVIDHEATGTLKLHARAHDPRSGRILEVWSTEPGLQFYSGNFLDGRSPRDVGKGRVRYGFRSAFCLEPSHFPDSVNHPHFPTTELQPGESYRGRIRYRFITDAAHSG